LQKAIHIVTGAENLFVENFVLAAVLRLLGDETFNIFLELRVVELIGVTFDRADKKRSPSGNNRLRPTK
jgi:hypothetical protein